VNIAAISDSLLESEAALIKAKDAAASLLVSVSNPKLGAAAVAGPVGSTNAPSPPPLDISLYTECLNTARDSGTTEIRFTVSKSGETEDTARRLRRAILQASEDERAEAKEVI